MQIKAIIATLLAPLNEFNKAPENTTVARKFQWGIVAFLQLLTIVIEYNDTALKLIIFSKTLNNADAFAADYDKGWWENFYLCYQQSRYKNV